MDGHQATGAEGCPFHAQAAAFDPFDTPYQADPAEALRWSREQLPVFFAPRLGYWVVSRYDDIKAVFRDNITYSPCIVLEKITPVRPEALEILKGYDFALNRTLVNEDEPAHMARRRALMEHFIPENLEPRAARIRALTAERIDRFINRGRAELVGDLLYEVPLAVALDFLGVPEDDFETFKRFSVAHTVNTWGRPSPEEQLEVAHSVGKFWRYAGEVLDRMRAEPDGPGWMHYAIRQNAVMPDVVTDNYLHSMMMAIIVAAHETTSLASANMFRLMLTHRQAWEDVCADPSLIPNAVEECLRHAGSVVAWRRQVTTPARLGGVDLPEGAKLLIVTASANHDPRHFEEPDRFDIMRENTTDHLTFGYGSHQCMGKNIGRMEMRIFLEEMSRRIPGLRLSEQDFSYLPNTSFRGPEAVHVDWDVSALPAQVGAPRDFAVGAPARRDVSRPVRVTSVRQEAEGVLGVTLEDARGRPLPGWSPGAHVELSFGGFDRKYSLCGRDGAWDIAILREDAGRGGSAALHDGLRPGTELRLRGPSNLFRLDETAPAYLLIAGGIGITPILAMADRLAALGKPFALHYAGRSRVRMALLGRAKALGAVLHVSNDGGRCDLAALVAGRSPGAQVYACGPGRMIEALEALDLPEGALHVERFEAAPRPAGATDEAFRVALADSGLELEVPAGRSLLDVVQAAGIDLACDCREGICGSCEVAVLEGTPDHRDAVLTKAERTEGRRMMACCSRAKGRLVLGL
ncbi:cytochrome P450/oxidoreductase [Mesobacterium pallidum]|uniref:cytochrome P450/oxidoreductase n=1 Tax=Mesobacterium pallidum TaxID=2872037 RepID=UPI001EE173E3|nr:cytochrome P450/oxidoreductase [Mesobacterium pallidum]